MKHGLKALEESGSSGNLKFPNFTSYKSLNLPTTSLQSYTVEKDGWLAYQMIGYLTALTQLYVNDVEIFSTGTGNDLYYAYVNGIIPLKKGDVIKYKSCAKRSNQVVEKMTMFWM